MCLSLQGNLYIFIVGHSEGTVLCLPRFFYGGMGRFFVSLGFYEEKYAEPSFQEG